MRQENERQASQSEENLLRAFHRLINGARFYHENHQTLKECAHQFMGAASVWWKDDNFLTIHISRERFLIQEEKVLYRRDNVKLIHELLQYFNKRRIQGLRFSSDLEGSSSDKFIEFVRMLNQAEQKEDPLAWIEDQIEAKGYFWAELVREAMDGLPQERDLERKEIAKRTYACAMESIQEVAEKIVTNKRAGVRKLKRVVQNMVNILTEDDSVLLFMSTIRNHDDYTYSHSVNVATLALCLGKRIGLSRISLQRLGICGLVHDLGKVEIPLEILNKPGKLTEPEVQEMERHPLNSVAQIIKLRVSRELKAKIMLPPFEHHLKYDLSGYPRIGRKSQVSLFGRILTIVDVFDALTSPRIYRSTAFSPDQALGMMVKGSGKDFDPILLKVFVNILGVYPIGTLLELDTQETALVMSTFDDDEPARPRVVLLSSDRKGGYVKGEVVDLAERDPSTGSFKRNVKRSLHPSAYGIQAAEFLL